MLNETKELVACLAEQNLTSSNLSFTLNHISTYYKPRLFVDYHILLHNIVLKEVECSVRIEQA